MGSYGVYTPICQMILTTNIDCKAMPFNQYPECIRACQYMVAEFQKQECSELYFLARNECSCQIMDGKYKRREGEKFVECTLKELSMSALECCKDQIHNCCWPI